MTLDALGGVLEARDGEADEQRRGDREHEEHECHHDEYRPVRMVVDESVLDHPGDHDVGKKGPAGHLAEPLPRKLTLARQEGRKSPVVKLVRVEHFDKGVPFDPALWTQPRATPAISGAVMAFDRECFERIGGFSTRYIFGHYEDADLSLRWREAVGPVLIDPDLQLMHLEGQGSHARGDHYKAAQIINRYLFSLKYNDEFAKNPNMMVSGDKSAPQPKAAPELKSRSEPAATGAAGMK